MLHSDMIPGTLVFAESSSCGGLLVTLYLHGTPVTLASNVITQSMFRPHSSLAEQGD